MTKRLPRRQPERASLDVLMKKVNKIQRLFFTITLLLFVQNTFGQS
jgi:hypothetical protein